MSAPSNTTPDNDIPDHVRRAAEALVTASPVPGPVIPWMQRQHDLTVKEACTAVGLANALRRSRQSEVANRG